DLQCAVRLAKPDWNNFVNPARASGLIPLFANPCALTDADMTSLFAAVELAPRDPILGLTEQYNADARPAKVNLGVGAYYNEEGKIPLLNAVRQAELARVEAAAARGYLPIEGLAAYNSAVQILLFGAHSPIVAENRAVTAQALGGT